MRGIIWALNREDGKQELLKMKENYKSISINPVREIMSSGEMAITFDNGDYWRVVLASTSARGYRANISYIDYRIDTEIVKQIIYPASIGRPYNAIHVYYPEQKDSTDLNNQDND